MQMEHSYNIASADQVLGHVLRVSQVTISSSKLDDNQRIIYRNHVIFAKTSGDVHVMDLDSRISRVLLPGGGHGRVHSLVVASRGLVLLGLSDGMVRVISMEDGSLVCQMKVRDPDNTEVTPGHVSHICHVTRDTRDHVTVVTSGGLLSSWVMAGHQPGPAFCIRQGMSQHSALFLITSSQD